MVVGELPVDLRQEQCLVSGSFHDAGETLKKREAFRLLRRRNPARGKCGLLRGGEWCEEREGVARRGHTREVSRLLVVAEEEEHLVLANRTTDGPSKLLTAVDRLELNGGVYAVLQHALCLERIGRAPFVVANEIERLTRVLRSCRSSSRR